MKKQKPTPETPKDQDHLEVYPERKQVSAFPERRFIKTNRFLVILALINLACILAGASIFIYTAKRTSVRVQNNRGLLLYQLDREEKKLKQAEYRERKISARQLIVESFLRQYIIRRHSFFMDDTAQELDHLLSKTSFINKSSSSMIQKSIENSLNILKRETFLQGRIRDVHIYNLHPYYNYGNGRYLWTAVIETFDFLKPDSGIPVCRCSDNSEQCLKCKYENTLYRRRRRIWAKTSFYGNRDSDQENKSKNPNPFGIRIEGYYEGYMPKDASNPNWDLPPELR